MLSARYSIFLYEDVHAGKQIVHWRPAMLVYLVILSEEC